MNNLYYNITITLNALFLKFMCLVKLKMSAEATEEIARQVLNSKMDLTKMREKYIKEGSAFMKMLPIKKRFHPSSYIDTKFDKEISITDEHITKKVKLTQKEITLAATNTVQIRLFDSFKFVNPTNTRYFSIINHLNTCAIEDCEYCMMTKITTNERNSFLMLNHIVRCTNPNCGSKGCFVLKNILNYNSLQSDLK